MQGGVLLRHDIRQESVREHLRAICMCLSVLFVVGSSSMALSSIVDTHVVAPMTKMINLVLAFANVSGGYMHE